MTTYNKRLLFAIIIGLLVVPQVGAAPWWWAQFSIGDGTNTSNSGFERWEAFAADVGAPATDTTYVCSYTWGSAAIGTVDGIAGASTAGLNNHSAAGGVPDYLISDAEGTDAGANWAQVQTRSDADVIDVDDGIGSPTMHIKDIFTENKGYLVSSANMTAGGWDSQHNNAIWFRWSGMSTGMRAKVREQFNEMAAGTFHDATQYAGGDIFYSPYGDTIELRYAPEDDDGGTGIGTGSILSRLRQLVSTTKESILFMSDAWTSAAGTTLLADDVVAKTGIIWRGCAGAGTDWDATLKSNFEGDANGTLRNQPGGFNQLHTKTIIFDLDIVATGSPNITSSMYITGSNDEAHVIVHDFRLARRYMSHYHHIMTNVGVTADPSADAYDNTAPAGATGLGVTPSDTAFYLNWTAAATTDISRYYLFIDTAALTQNGIGDRVDDDADGYYDEDPRGDYDGFPSGTTGPGKTADDDDADGASDEDLWFPPEAQVKGRASTTGAITTVNVGDSLVASRNYWFAVVSVDTQGNEGAIATAGPFQLAAAGADTKILVTGNSSIADTSVPRGNTTVLALNVWIRGDTTGGGDTLSFFAVKNLGNADTRDVTVRLWRDENADSKVTAADSLVANLTYTGATGRWQSAITNDSRAYLGTTAGKTFLVAINIYDTAGIGDTWQSQIDAQTCDAVRWNTGPAAIVTNTGVITIVSANQVVLVKRGDFASETIGKGDTKVVMTARLSISQANDTVIAFTVQNLGTMLNADVAAIRIYEDASADSLLSAADTLVANIPFASGTTWRNVGVSYPFTGTSVNLLVVLATNSGATAGRSFQSQIPAFEVDTTKGDSGPTSTLFTSALFSIPSDTGPDTAIVINEFIASPNNLDHDNDGTKGDTDEEFVELYNNSDQNVSIAGWKLDDDLTPGDDVFPAGLILGPRQFLTLYNDSQAVGPRWFRYDTSGTVVLETGSVTGLGFALNTTADTCILVNASNIQVDSRVYSSETSDSSHARIYDGAETWTTAARVSPGKNQDPTATFNNPSPNAVFSLSPSSFSVNEGESLTLTITMQNRVGQTVATFTQSALLYANRGTMAPSGTGNFSASVRAESVSVSNMTATESVVLTAQFNKTTTGTTVITVNNLATVSCTIVLEARSVGDYGGCTGVLTNGGYTDTRVSNAAGTISFPAVPPGSYTLTTKENHHLQRVTSGISVTGSDTAINIGSHRAGDANNDNKINIFDGSIIRYFMIFGTGAKADINNSGTVTNADLGWVRLNFGVVGQ